jgi:hypothetical protein
VDLFNISGAIETDYGNYRKIIAKLPVSLPIETALSVLFFPFAVLYQVLYCIGVPLLLAKG